MFGALFDENRVPLKGYDKGSRSLGVIEALPLPIALELRGSGFKTSPEILKGSGFRSKDALQD